MRTIGLSSLALMAAIGFAAPAQAQLLNLGGDNGTSVNVGGNGGATVTLGGGDNAVSVDLGSDGDAGSGGSSGVLNLGGNGDGSTGSLLDLGGNGSILDLGSNSGVPDLGGAGGAGVPDTGLLNLNGINDGVILDLFGNGAEDDAIVDIGLGDDDSVTNGGVPDVTGDGNLLSVDDLFDNGEVTGDDILLDLFGPDSTPDDTPVAVDLSGEDNDANDVVASTGGDDLAILDVFGNGEDDDVAVDLNGDDGGTPDVTANAAGRTVTLDVLGLGNATETGGGGNGGGGNGGGDPGDGNGNGGGGGGNGGGDVADGGGDGSGNGGDDTGGGPSIGIGANGGIDANANGLSISPRPAVRVAAVSAKCFTPNESQIQYLINNRNYDQSMSASWSSANGVDLVPIKLCPQARTRVAAAIDADPDIQWLQDAVDANARLGGELHAKGLNGENVLALDNKDGGVKLYVF